MGVANSSEYVLKCLIIVHVHLGIIRQDFHIVLCRKQATGIGFKTATPIQIHTYCPFLNVKNEIYRPVLFQYLNVEDALVLICSIAGNWW